MAFGFFRSVWISIRAANYTSQAFQQVSKSLEKLERDQVNLRISAAKNMMQTGLLYTAMGGIIIGTISRIMQTSELGKEVMEAFGERIGKSMTKLGEAFARILAPVLSFLASLLELATAHPILAHMIALVVTLLAFVITLKGAYMAFKGVLELVTTAKLLAILATKNLSAEYRQYLIDTLGASSATWMLAVSLQAVIAGFMVAITIVTAISTLFGKTAGIIAAVTIAIIGLAIAIAALRASAGDVTGVVKFGAALAAGGAMGAAFLATYQAPEMQMGTAFVRKGGLYRLHEGEEVTSARESRIASRMEQVRPLTYKRSSWFVPITIGTVYTKADKETLVPTVKRILKDELDDRM